VLCVCVYAGESLCERLVFHSRVSPCYDANLCTTEEIYVFLGTPMNCKFCECDYVVGQVSALKGLPAHLG